MARTRIRWRNLGRLLAVIAAAGVVIAVVPGLLEPPEPEPLPADVGLVAGAGGTSALQRPAAEPPRQRLGPPHGRQREPRPRPKPEREPAPKPPFEPGPDRKPKPAAITQPSIPPPSIPPPSSPDPPPSPPPPASPPPAPVASPAPEPSPSPPASDPATVKAEFGFEP